MIYSTGKRSYPNKSRFHFISAIGLFIKEGFYNQAHHRKQTPRKYTPAQKDRHNTLWAQTKKILKNKGNYLVGEERKWAAHF